MSVYDTERESIAQENEKGKSERVIEKKRV